MQSNYKPIGDYIQLVDERNKELKVTRLLGLSISKEFIRSVANTVGTDMRNYKIIRKNQFACSTMQVRRDRKMPVALLTDFDEAIISQAYPIFEIRDETQLLPEYLMMWFSRAEFDRQAEFLAVGGVRGTLEWEDFLAMELPIPSIEKQQEIVKEYNVVKNRIALNEQINQNLEETAQALYNHWFVDFEFPVTKESQPDLVSGSQPVGYKSAGGKMVFNEELDREVPKGWEVRKLEWFSAMIKRGITPKYTERNGISVINQRCIRNNTVDLEISRQHNLDLRKVPKEKILKKSDILINSTGTGTLGRVALIKEIRRPTTVDTHVTIVRPSDQIGKLYLWYNLSSRTEEIEYLGKGSTGQTELSREDLGDILLLEPDIQLQLKFENNVFHFVDKTLYIDVMKSRLLELQSLLLSKMATVESEKNEPILKN